MALDHALRHSVGVRAVHSDDDAAGTGLRIGAWSAHGGDSPERRRGCAVPVAGLRAGAPVPLAILLPDLVTLIRRFVAARRLIAPCGASEGSAPVVPYAT